MCKDQFPDSIIAFSKDLIDICKKHKLSKFNAEINGDYFDQEDCRYWDTIHFRWEQGRHGAAANKLVLFAKKDMRMEVENGQAWPG